MSSNFEIANGITFFFFRLKFSSVDLYLFSSIHSFFFSIYSSIDLPPAYPVRVGVGLVFPSRSLWVKYRVHPGQVASFWHSKAETQRYKHTVTTKDNLEKPVNPTVMYFDCGRNPECWESSSLSLFFFIDRRTERQTYI